MHDERKGAIGFDYEKHYQWLEGDVLDTGDASAILGAMLGTMKGMCFMLDDVLDRLGKLEEQNEMNEKDPEFKPFMADHNWLEDAEEDDSMQIAALVEESRRMVTTVKAMMEKIDELDKVLRERLPNKYELKKPV